MEDQTRFASINEDEIARLLAEKDSTNTKRSTKVAVGVFQKYLLERQTSSCYVHRPIYLQTGSLRLTRRDVWWKA